MAWSYTTGVLTSTGATEASPDSLLAGIAVVQTADATRGYRNGFVAWLNNVRIVYVNSFVKVDNDATIEFRGASYFASGGAVGFIGGSRAKLIMNTGTVPGIGTTTTNTGFMTGSTFITQKSKPNDPAFQIIYINTARLDFPSVVNSTQVLAKADINGLDLYTGSITTSNFFRMFFANATISSIKDIRVFDSSTGSTGEFPNGLNIFLFSGTYDAIYREKNDFGSENVIVNTVTLTKPTFYNTTASPLIGFIRSATFNVINPSFLNNCWDGLASFNSTMITEDSKLSFLYSYTNQFKIGLTALENVNVRFTRSRESVNGSPTWTAPNATFTATSNASGTYTTVNLLDTYRKGTSLTDLERFNWTAKARKYDRRTAGETIFENRVLYKHSVNMSAGYSEEVQMLQVPYITLTEAQALALAGISFAPSGTTSGVITLTQSRTVAELWQSYRAWISQTANFDSEDSWTYDGTTLNIGGWSIVGLQFLTNGAITTNTATAVGVLSNITINGNVNQNVPTNLNNVVITETLTYNTNTNTTITITDTAIGTVVNLGTGIITINKVNSTIYNYTDAEINFIDSTISVIGADTVTFHPTANDRDLNINASGSFSGSYAFKFGSTINGSVMSGTLYLRCVAGGIPFNINKAIVLGDNLVDLGTTAQLASLSAKIDLTAKEATAQNIKNNTDLIPATL